MKNEKIRKEIKEMYDYIMNVYIKSVKINPRIGGITDTYAEDTIDYYAMYEDKIFVIKDKKKYLLYLPDVRNKYLEHIRMQKLNDILN